MARGHYSVVAEAQAISTAITILEVTAPSTAILDITRAWISSNSTTSAMNRIELLRKSGTITGTASPPSALGLDASPTSGVTVKWKATAEGTDGNVLYPDYFNSISGWVWSKVDGKQQILVPPSGIIALKFPAAPANVSWTYGIEWDELG